MKAQNKKRRKREGSLEEEGGRGGLFKAKSVV
jgi:hypothetical protein